MARHTFLGDLASWVLDTGAAETATDGISAVHALTVPNQVVTFWDAATGGTQYTDLLDANGDAITQTTSDTDGSLAQISGPDGITTMWADAAGGSGPRTEIQATDIWSNGFLQLAGGAMTGELTLAADPVNPLDAATKQYVDNGAGYGIVRPSGDTTGATDPVSVATAIGTYGAARLVPGNYYGNTTVQIGLGQAVHGAGNSQVTWYYSGSGPAFQLENSGTYSTTEWAELTGLTVDGTDASAGAIGVQFGDIVQLRIDVDVRNFSGTGSIGLYACNAYYWTEQATVRSFINNCTTGCELDVTGNGTNSFLRSRFDLYFNQGSDQDGLVIAGTSTGVALTEGVVRLHGNWAEGSSATGAVIRFTNSSSWIEACQIDIGVEPGASGSGGAFVQTINFTSEDATQIVNCYGVMQFDNSFTASNNHANIWFDGPIYGDNSLLSLQAHPEVYAGYSSGYPTGWSGDVFFACPRGDGRIDFHVELTIASGTVVTAGETILSGLPSWAYYTGETRYVVVTLVYSGYTPVVLAITSGGDLLYEGTGFTVSGTAYLTGGVAQYSNGYY